MPLSECGPGTKGLKDLTPQVSDLEINAFKNNERVNGKRKGLHR